jgi:hypothetical protein
MRAAATSDRTGWPRMAAVEPISRRRPSTPSRMPRFEMSVAGSAQVPSTKAEDEELSAITSPTSNLKSA